MSSIDLLSPQDWTFPVPIAYGPGRIKQLEEFCSRLAVRNPLIVTDRGSSELAFIQQAQQTLVDAGLPAQVFSDISPNPRDDEIEAGCDAFRKGDHDGVIAIGGGSGMDGGKAICLTVNKQFDLWDFEYDSPSPDVKANSFPPLITIPTTAGTGAETESTAMITDTGRGMKLCIWHSELKPSLALLDPELTLGLPANLTAWTGCDALVHAIEAYCVSDFHPLCDGAALQALGLIHRWLPEAVDNGRNLEARGAMLVGSCLAGIAFLKGLGLVHAISHMVGAQYDTHHGLTNSIVLPSVLTFNEPYIADKVPAMATAMQLDSVEFATFYSAICRRLDEFSIPVSLTDIGVPKECVAEIAVKTLQDSAAATNPHQPSVGEAEMVVETALIKGR